MKRIILILLILVIFSTLVYSAFNPSISKPIKIIKPKISCNYYSLYSSKPQPEPPGNGTVPTPC